MNKENLRLVGHLQVLDEPLSSLYSDNTSGQYFLFVRIFEDNDDKTFVLSEVKPSEIVDYIDKRLGLNCLFAKNKSLYFKYKPSTKKTDIKKLKAKEALKMLQDDSLDDLFDDTLSCHSVAIKKYLLNVQNALDYGKEITV